MGKYYGEELNPKSTFRSEYEQTLTAFIDAKLNERKATRQEFLTPEKLKANPEFYRELYVKTLGYPLDEPRVTPTLIKKEFIASDKGVNIYRMQFSCFGGIKFFGLYFEQTENKQSAPFIMAFHGKEGTPELCSSIYMDSSNYNHMVRRATDRGANVFVPQTLLWSEQFYDEPYDRLFVDAKLRQLGGCVTALEVKLSSDVITYFIENENIKQDRIGALGLSYGGMFTVYLTAFDKRIKCACSCSFVNSTEGLCRMNDWCHFNEANTFGVAEVCALICPRPLVVAMGDKDQLFDSKLTLEQGERIKEFYKAYGKVDNLVCYEFDGYHEFDKSDKGLDFLFKNL